MALNLSIDMGVATVITALIVALSQAWQSWMIRKVHTLVNSNFHEAKAARLAAESALHTALALNHSLQQQLDEQVGK